ncbi:MAG: MBL fold metallo-hydrolase [Rhodocyclaceae bacterium]|nr:MBL fold metallo-hydrolase [Rhodocyclaceae bacterium]MCA3073002.1 MBL fold metallo-hydrolase [Rhodocyclaceae bacterium]MCA3088722.1 MBL fold metallo-hydrolase [Rhodocyclaceae bacterium]MCA3092494.1 MBL fold metallo-hydrolase [Rhodocyclaceae bacterium]MCA3097326.1 MBL fold metallo-hydrolase [Rhodocyclaceae bacterium]
MRFCSLGSGSTGNAWLVESGKTRVLIDCGIGPDRLTARLLRAGIDAASIDAILVTHEHDDHVGGAAAFSRRHSIPVHATYGTVQGSGAALAGIDRLLELEPSGRLSIGDIEVLPVAVPHDAREPVQYVLGDGVVRLGVITDLGSITPHVIAAFSGLDALVLEANHDEEMLRQGPYPKFLKERVGGRYGHLSNAVAARLLGAVAGDRLQHVVAAHLSLKNNTALLARSAFAAALGCAGDWIAIATEDGLDWREITPVRG